MAPAARTLRSGARALSVLLGLLGLAACAARNPYTADSTPLPPVPAASSERALDPSAYPAAPLDFSAYRSWRWQALPAGSGVIGPEQVQEMVAGALDQHGLRPAPAQQKADVEVSVGVRNERRIRQVYDDYGGYYGRGPYDRAYGAWGSVPLVRSYEEEVLVVQIELFDPALGRRVWSNRAEARVSDDRGERADALRRAIAQALEDYPPR